MRCSHWVCRHQFLHPAVRIDPGFPAIFQSPDIWIPAMTPEILESQKKPAWPIYSATKTPVFASNGRLLYCLGSEEGDS